MKCEKCGRPLEANEEKLCPHCKNESNRKVKIGAAIGGGVLATAGAILLAIFGGKKK